MEFMHVDNGIVKGYTAACKNGELLPMFALMLKQGLVKQKDLYSKPPKIVKVISIREYMDRDEYEGENGVIYTNSYLRDGRDIMDGILLDFSKVRENAA